MKALSKGTKVRVKPHTVYRECQPGYCTIDPPQEIQHNGYHYAEITGYITQRFVDEQYDEEITILLGYEIKTKGGYYDEVPEEYVEVLT